MRIVSITVYLILNKPSLMRMKGYLLKNAESLEALLLKHSGFNYFLPLKTAECGLQDAEQTLKAGGALELQLIHETGF